MNSSFPFVVCLWSVILACHPHQEFNFAGYAIIEHPSEHGGQSSLTTSRQGVLYCSWLEYRNDSLVELRYSHLKNDHWTNPQLIAQGDQWFVNWADFPSMAVNDSWMVAHWLEYRGAGTYDYDVKMVVRKMDEPWGSPFIPHTDGIAAEHGFVSLLSVGHDQVMAFWLDGRNIKTATDHEAHTHAHSGAMTLRTAQINGEGVLTEERELDPMVCDCCQTSAAMTSLGPVVTYRNRSEGEIRDIYLARSVAGEWQEPKPVFNDGWKIGGCPVNGPAIDAYKENLAIAWFTMAGDSALVKLIFSSDAGETFSTPVLISDQDPLGRVDIAYLDAASVLVTWVENNKDGQADIMGCVVSQNLSRSESFKIIQTSAARKSGFPRLAVANKNIYMSWTDTDEIGSRVKTARIIFDDH